MLQQTSSTSSSFEARESLAERLNLRVVLFVAVVLVPVMALGYVYFKAAFGSGIEARDDGYVFVDLQKMSSFSFDQRNGTLEQVPEQWRALDGKQVILEGEMWSTKSSAPELSEFDLVWSVANCCFTGSPQVQHFVHSKTADGGTVPYYAEPVRVKGRLKVDVTRSEGQVTGVYHLDVESVEPTG
jgi:hypothetical protein